MPAPENLTIDTPEQSPLEFALAGVGSRFLALAFDSALQLAGIVVLVIVAVIARRLAGISVTTASLGTWATALLIAGAFVIYSGYFAIFESVWAGQTPGKRLVGLRVIDLSGRPLAVYGAIVRNLLRIVDQLPGIYGVAILCVLVTRRQQRLGDLAAGTVVVHERLEAAASVAASSSTVTRHGAARLTAEEILVIEGFLRRREDLDAWVRLQSARRIAARMAEKLGIPSIEDEERLLEQLAAEYRSTDQYR